MSPPLKAVFFDAAGTLIYLARPVGEHYRGVALRHGLDLSAQELDKAFRSCWKEMPPRPRIVGPRLDDDKGWWRDLVSRVIERTASPETRKTFDEVAYFEELYAHFAEPGVWSAYPEVEGVLEGLKKRGVKLGVISNFDRRLYRVLGHLGLTRFFESIVISSEVGADKPDPAIFERALSLLEVDPAEAVHVGDDPKRDWGANITGLDVFELERPARSLEDLVPWLDSRGRR